MLHRAVWIAVIAALAGASGACSRNKGVRCDDSSRYASAGTIPPVRVPDDLSVPDESQALLIPDVPAGVAGPPPGQCLESPPEFAAPPPSR